MHKVTLKKDIDIKEDEDDKLSDEERQLMIGEMI